MAATRTRAQMIGLLVVVAISTPLAIVVETGLRMLMFPPEFQELRRMLGPRITPWVWTMVPAAIAGTVLGLRLQRWLVARRLVKERVQPPNDTVVRAAQFDALMLSSSAPQVPALAATFGFMLGADPTPVAVAMATATLGVLVQAKNIPQDA